MSVPHDPWAAGPSPEPEPPPEPREPVAAPTDQTIIRNTDGTYLRPASPPNYQQQTPNYQQQNYPQPPNYLQVPGYQQPNQQAPNYRPAQSYQQGQDYQHAPTYPQALNFPPAPTYAPAQPVASFGPGYGGPIGPGNYFPTGGYPPGPPPKSGQKRPLIIGLCVLLVAVLGTVGWLALRPTSSPAFTFAGKRIADADAVLTTAQKTTAELVTSRHGASNSDTRCYFAPADDTSQGHQEVRHRHEHVLRPGAVRRR